MTPLLKGGSALDCGIYVLHIYLFSSIPIYLVYYTLRKLQKLYLAELLELGYRIMHILTITIFLDLDMRFILIKLMYTLIFRRKLNFIKKTDIEKKKTTYFKKFTLSNTNYFLHLNKIIKLPKKIQ